MAKSKKTQRMELTPLELLVMNVIWELGECGSREVIDAFNRRAKRPLADTTIRTVMAGLRKKGHIAPVPTPERGVRFRAVMNRDSTARRLFRQLISPLFGDSPGQALAYLIKHEAISAEEMEEIRKMVKAARKGGRP
jgi:predicted transcriptional regulator